MITDSNGMPVLQPLVDDASTATFNTAFATIGTSYANRRFFSGTADERNAWSGSGKAKVGDHWQDSNGDRREYVYTGSAWGAELKMKAGTFGGTTASSGIVTVNHGLGLTPDGGVGQIRNTASDAVNLVATIIRWDAPTSTQIQFRLRREDTHAYYQDAIAFDWYVWKL